MSHAAPKVTSLVLALLCLTQTDPPDTDAPLAPIDPFENVVAYAIHCEQALHCTGSIMIDPQQPPPNEDSPPPIKLGVSSIIKASHGHGFGHTPLTNQVPEDLIHSFLDSVPDITHLHNNLWLNHGSAVNASKVADFKLHIVSKSEGKLLRQSPENTANLIYHEESLVTSGLATVVFPPPHDITNIEDFELVLRVLAEFGSIASDIKCQNIWVTIQIGDHQKIGICWPNYFTLLDQ